MTNTCMYLHHSHVFLLQLPFMKYMDDVITYTE